MLVSEIKVALKRYGFDDEDPLLIWINAAYHEIEKAYPKWPWLEKTEIKALAAAQATLLLTGNVKRFVKVRDVTHEVGQAGEGIDLTFYDRRYLWRAKYNLNESGEPEIFTIIGPRELQFFPVPT